MRKRTTKKENVFSWKDNKIKYQKKTGVVLTKQMINERK
jgi:hypothetical protein